MKLSDYVLEFLAQKGIKNMFYLPGGGCMHLLNSLAVSKSINGISLLHEQSVSIAAESYAFTKEDVGAALVTTGPGGTNAVTGALSAFVDSMPVFFVSGQVKTNDLKTRFKLRQLGSQEADIISIVTPITKYAVMVTNKDSIRFHLEKAWYEMVTGRCGPVWLDIPLDIQGSSIEPEELYAYTPPLPEEYEADSSVDSIISYIGEAERPVLLTGNGALKCKHKLSQLINKMGIPVIPSWKACDTLPDDHPLLAGKCGTLGERSANFAMQSADLIISLGCKLDFSITGYDRTKWAVKAKKIIVDIDEAEINKLQVPVDIPVICDVEIIINKLLNKDIKTKDLSAWISKINQWRERYPVILPEHFEKDKPISTYALIDTLSKHTKSDAVIVPASAGTVAEIFYQAFKVKKGQIVRSNHGLGSMGYEIPSAIGAYFATSKEVICVAGDGGMQLNIQELSVISGRKLPIKIFVVNNSGYSSIRNMQRNHFEGLYFGSNSESGLFIPDMCELASAYGIECGRVEKIEDLDDGVSKALSHNGPYICDVIIDPFCIVSPRASSKVLPDGQIVSSPLEDLFPFLGDEIIKQEMEV